MENIWRGVVCHGYGVLPDLILYLLRSCYQGLCKLDFAELRPELGVLDQQIAYGLCVGAVDKGGAQAQEKIAMPSHDFATP